MLTRDGRELELGDGPGVEGAACGWLYGPGDESCAPYMFMLDHSEGLRLAAAIADLRSATCPIFGGVMYVRGGEDSTVLEFHRRSGNDVDPRPERACVLDPTVAAVFTDQLVEICGGPVVVGA